MKYEETKYCEECTRCKTISKNGFGQYEVKCWCAPMLPDNAVYYCKHKKLKKEKKENVK